MIKKIKKNLHRPVLIIKRSKKKKINYPLTCINDKKDQ